MNNLTIGNRAAEEIKKQAMKNGTSLHKEGAKIGVASTILTSWKRNTNPSAYFLQQMALAGYDVIYILTGEKK